MSKTYQSKWIEYEHRKAAWISKHPGATQIEYEQFILRLSRELGV